MPKICDNKSVGLLVWNERGELLLIERKKYNFGFAPVAGHLDGLTPEDAGDTELSEEIGLTSELKQKVFERDLQNTCKREGGTHHFWTVYKVEKWNGSLKPSEDETKGYVWASPERLRELAKRLEDFAVEQGIDLKDLPAILKATNEVDEWRQNPGLEPAWYPILKDLKII